MNKNAEHSLKVQDYTIFFTKNNGTLKSWLTSKNYSKIFVLSDENTRRDCLPIWNDLKACSKITIPAGEKHKNLTTCELIWNFLLENKADRKSLLILLGGGVVTDMGAFCASTFKRGIDFINIPTSLLAQVDATVGGKTGIDFQFQKNMIGLFASPQAIFVNSLFLKTLPDKELKSGYAEMLKHGLLNHKNYWNQLLSYDSNDLASLEALIFESINFKKSVVEADPFEKGHRKILNFGHTIGHALESYFLQKNIEVTHGEAVAWGMIAEIWLSNKILNFDFKEMETISSEIAKRYPLKAYLQESSFAEIIGFMLSDKKNQQQKILAVLLSEIGKPKINIELDEILIKESFQFLNKLNS